jgi:branched-chain amino acid transport system ATP-binding protein
MEPILEIKKLSKSFGGLAALKDLDIQIERGEIFGLIGPNGSGKTTLLNVITGFLEPTAGSVIYKGQSIGGVKSHQIAEKGIIRTFQITSTFADLTAEDNVMTGAYLKTKGGIWGSFFKTESFKNEESKLRKKADKILDFMEMQKGTNMPAKDLPAADQRKLEIAIALAGEPELLLLDEPAAGMNLEEQARLLGLIRSIHNKGITIGMVEHNMKMIMGLCTRIVVLNYGSKIAEGIPDEIINDERVISVYLGRKRGHA